MSLELYCASYVCCSLLMKVGQKWGLFERKPARAIHGSYLGHGYLQLQDEKGFLHQMLPLDLLWGISFGISCFVAVFVEVLDREDSLFRREQLLWSSASSYRSYRTGVEKVWVFIPSLGNKTSVLIRSEVLSHCIPFRDSLR